MKTKIVLIFTYSIFLTFPFVFANDELPITTLSDWENHRKELQEDWIKFLGPMAAVRTADKIYPPPKIEVLEETQADGFTRKKIRYVCEPEQQTLAYLLIPNGVKQPRPGIVVFHSTVKDSYHQGAGVSSVTEKSFGYHLARRGYVVICPQNYLWESSDKHQLVYEQESKNFHQRQPKNKGMARMLLDGQIAVDILVSLPEVNSKQIGCVGHSLGAKQAFYLPAFDERVFCSVSSEGGIGVEQSNWEAEWYLGSEIKQPNFPRNHREIAALLAPRPFLLIGGDSADGVASANYIESARSVYRLYGESNRIELFNHKKQHTVPPEAEEKIYQWFEKYLPLRD